jgi:hypothetical protein
MAQRLGVANGVVNGLDMLGLIVYHPALGQWYGVAHYAGVGLQSHRS